MWFHQKLRWRLSEILNLIFYCFPYHDIVDRVQFRVTLVRQIVENVSRTHSFRACENRINEMLHEKILTRLPLSLQFYDLFRRTARHDAFLRERF